MFPMKKLATVLLTLCLGTSVFAQAPNSAPAPEAPSPSDVNYAFGILLGQSLATTGLDFDLKTLVLGIQDALGKGGPARLDAEQAKQIVSAALQAAQEKVNQAQVDKENLWLAEHAKKTGVTTTASGLQYEVLTPGTGARPVLTDTVKVNYVGTLIDGTEFDSSIQRGEPAIFPLDQVIPAWTEGLQLMTVGGKYRFTIPSKLAYGAEGAGGGVIPPFATIVFEVDLISIEPAAEEEAH